MKAQLRILLVLMVTLPGQCGGQQKAKPKDLTIEDVLSCANDPLISSVFGFGDNVSKLSPQAKAYDPKLVQSYGFWILVSVTAGETELTIMPKEQNNSFCRYHPTIDAFTMPENGTIHYPIHVTVDPGEAWTLDPNEVFAHADKFTFKSGVFSNSTDVFLIAKRGITSIQFIFADKKLKLYRVVYDNPKVE